MSEIVAATASQVLEGVAAAEGQAAGETVAEWPILRLMDTINEW